MLGTHPSIEVSQTSEYAKQRAKWESEPSKFGAPGRPYEFREFPKRLSRATRGEKGPEFEGATANSPDEEQRLKSVGFHCGRDVALNALTRDEREHAILAAERNFEIVHGRVSDRAASEVRAAEAEHGAKHLPMIPETPIKKRGRPAKAPANS